MKIIVLLSIIFLSCTKVFNDSRLNVNKKILVIEGCINNVPTFQVNNYGLPTFYELYDTYVRVKEYDPLENINPNSDANSNYIYDALVIIKDDFGNIDTLKTPTNPTYKTFANRYPFIFDYKLQSMTPIPGRTYYLGVYYNNSKYTAQTTIPLNRPTIDSFKIETNNIVNQNPKMSSLILSGEYAFPSRLKTSVFFKDIPGEKNYYIFKPFNYKLLDVDLSLNAIYGGFNRTTDSVLREKNITLRYFKYLDGWQTNVLADDYLNSSNSNQYYPFLGYWLGKKYSSGVESENYGYYSFLNYNFKELSKADYYFIKYVANNPKTSNSSYNYLYDYQAYKTKYPLENSQRNIFFGTIDVNSYNFFYGLKELYKNDGGSFSPSPVTPNSNITGGAFGYFYGVNAFVFPLLSNYPCTAYTNGIHKYIPEDVFKYYNNEANISLDTFKNRNIFETLPFVYPFSDYK